MSSKYTKKRKGGRDEDTSHEGQQNRARRAAREEQAEDDSDSSPPPTQRKKKPERSGADKGGTDNAESMSVEDTNKLRAKLGLAPLVTDDTPKPVDEENEEEKDPNVYNEDGILIHHAAAVNWGAQKKERSIKEKIETAKHKRLVQERVLKAKKLAEDDGEDDANAWVEKMRKQEEDRKKAEDKYNEIDEEFGVRNLIDEEKEKAKRKKAREALKKRREQEEAMTGGLIVGHSKQSFMGGKDQILVLEDKSVLDDGDEVLVNPNLIDNERGKKNVDLKKKKDRYRAFDDAYDEQGNAKKQQLLAKYDEELEGDRPQRFRLDDRGEVDLEREEEEARARALQEMAGKKLVSLDMEKFKVASEFYTQEEMISFRKPKKAGKERKSRKKLGKVLKADDIKPLEDVEEQKDFGSRRRGRHGSDDDEEERMETEEKAVGKEPGTEDGELEEAQEDGEGGTTRKGWKKATKGTVDIEALRRLAAKAEEEEDESDDDEMTGPALYGAIIDDEAADELNSMLDRARRLKHEEARPDAADAEAAAKRTLDMLQQHGGGRIKKEDGEDEEMETEEQDEDAVCIDSTMEYCRNIGELHSYGIGGNRTDSIDVSTVARTEERKKEKKEAGVDEFESVQKWKRAQAEKERKKRARREAHMKKKESKGGWRDESKMDSDDERDMEEVAREIKEEEPSDEDLSDGEYKNVLGDDTDVQKGVGSMLKLAAQKGYLNDPNAKKTIGQSLEHLQNKRATRMESERFDMEDKYVKKLERMGTTGSGPARPFQEKKEYKPEIVLEYVDNKGREMEPKDAFREMSWKFHGKKPGKKQVEKRSARKDKKELMKKTESWDTPLGTLNKQLKKQEQLQSPYIVLSNTSRQTELKKE